MLRPLARLFRDGREDRHDGGRAILNKQQLCQGTEFYAIDPGCRSGKSNSNVVPTPFSLAPTSVRPP